MLQLQLWQLAFKLLLLATFLHATSARKMGFHFISSYIFVSFSEERRRCWCWCCCCGQLEAFSELLSKLKGDVAARFMLAYNGSRLQLANLQPRQI